MPAPPSSEPRRTAKRRERPWSLRTHRTYARDCGWLLEDERFDHDRVQERTRKRVAEIAPAAAFRSSVVDSAEPTVTPRTTAVREIKRVAAVVFVGTENAGSVVAPDSSIGGPVANDPQSDVYVVRNAERSG
ncbi:hypothetical protein [Natrononativus amylolyticus]|uniref:hypothetical protein n=1 Tax=Natrononativus amylolyticus TaxID=2963434 RepID=UPI0031F2E135